MIPGFFLFDFRNGTCQLVGAGGIFISAADAGEFLLHFVNIHTLYQFADALQVSVAAADILNIFDFVVLYLEENPAGAGASGFVFVLHCDFPFLFFCQVGHVHAYKGNEIFRGEYHLLTPRTGGYGNFIVQFRCFINKCWIRFLHTDGTAATADVTGE